MNLTAARDNLSPSAVFRGFFANGNYPVDVKLQRIEFYDSSNRLSFPSNFYLFFFFCSRLIQVHFELSYNELNRLINRSALQVILHKLQCELIWSAFMNFFFIYFVHKIGIDVGRSETLTDIDLTVGRPSIDPAIDCLID